MTRNFFLILTFFISSSSFAQSKIEQDIKLNGIWKFEQTTEAFRPDNFSRKIQVPGLVHLASPRIEEYDKLFKYSGDTSDGGWSRKLLKMDYTPRYSWYKKKVFINEDLQDLEAILTLNKSKYVTQVYVNGIDLGSYIQCYTPINTVITHALKFGEENEILFKLGDRYWLPSSAAGGIDKEKEHYIAGIWDDVTISFSKKIQVHRLLVLPNLKERSLNLKAKLRNLNKFSTPGDPRTDKVKYTINIYEKYSNKKIAEKTGDTAISRDQISMINVNVPIANAHAWSPDDPFLYKAELIVYSEDSQSDIASDFFGMRDFYRDGKSFYLNGEKIYLRGSNITLHRFFEDPKSRDLAWDKEWVKRMMIDVSKELHWNTMRICVGIVPDFWYDLADEYGILLQNEWMYWQMHGWDAQISKEYTDWVWSDGSHPSIVIWDAINENRNDYIGNTLIPELKLLDPTRIWDAGYMTASQMTNDDMDEPHTYQGRKKDGIEKTPYPLGKLDFKPKIVQEIEESNSAQLVNEYGWVWLWRDGSTSKLSKFIYNTYLGPQSTIEERRDFQAYWLQCETEWMRSNESIAGVLAFCLLTNNYGYTGDWFVDDIKDLKISPTLYWLKHSFDPTTVFLNVADERYALGQPIHKNGEIFKFSLRGINDEIKELEGEVTVKLLDSQGDTVYSDTFNQVLPASGRIDIPYEFELPDTSGGYLLVSEFKENTTDIKSLSRRYIKIGEKENYDFYEMKMPVNYTIPNASSNF